MNNGWKFLKKLWCCVGGGNITAANLHFRLSWYNRIIKSTIEELMGKVLNYKSVAKELPHPRNSSRQKKLIFFVRFTFKCFEPRAYLVCRV